MFFTQRRNQWASRWQGWLALSPSTAPGWPNRARAALTRGHRQMQRLIAVLQVPHSAFLLREPPAAVRQGRQVPTPMQILQIVEILYIHSILEILESE
jgi:hypothetical protein